MPTTNPVPSTDPSDLLFNAGKLDEVVNSTANSFTDRLGVARRTVAGMNADFDAQLADAESDLNVYRADAAASAAEALGYLQTIRATSYGAYAEDPTTDPLGNPPTEGDEYWNTAAKLLKRWNGTTWQASDINTANLAAPSGSSLVGYDGGTVQDVLDGAKSLQDYAALRAYSGRATRIYITGLLVTKKPAGIAGQFQYDPTDTSSIDNNGTIIVLNDGRRFKRDFSGALNVGWFDLTDGGVVENVTAVQAAIDTGHPVLTYPSGTYKVTGAVLKSYQKHFGNGTVLTSTGSIFTPQGNAQLVEVAGFSFTGSGRAIDQPDTALYSVSFHIHHNRFSRSLEDCIRWTPINCTTEYNQFGAQIGGTAHASHKHIIMQGKPTGSTAVNANVVRKNHFSGAKGSESVYLYYGTCNEFAQNIWEENGTRPLRVNGGGVTKLDNNFLESNDGAHQIRFEADATVTSTIYYNRVISATRNTFNLLKAGNTHIFSLDANSLNLSLTHNQYYTNQSGVYVTYASTGNNGGVTEFGRNSNYAASINETGLFNFSSLTVSGKTVIGGSTAADATLVVKRIGANIPLRVVDASDTNLFYVGGTGQLSTGLGTDSPYNSTTASAANLVVLSNGVLQRSTSSLKYKTDVQDAVHGLAEVMKLRAVTYRGKSDGDKIFGGLIAEEVHEVGLSEFVVYGNDGAPDALAYANMVSLLVKAVQDLKREFDEYKISHP